MLNEFVPVQFMAAPAMLVVWADEELLLRKGEMNEKLDFFDFCCDKGG
jgi:hypothetical protein